MTRPAHDPESVVHLDATQLRALAHPLRMRLLARLRREGPATASALARRFGTNSGQTSYHLRQLAEAGLVEDDPEHGDGRDRWWRAAHESTSWSSTEFVDDPDAKAADAWLLGHLIRRHGESLGAWLDEREHLPAAWMSASDLSDLWLVMTPERLKAMSAELHAVIARYRAEPPDTAPDAREVTVHLHAFPTAESDR
ncbi:helix-turn-helix domain-containing protein [Aquihabitans sp. G128]|uniref:winged helix-turn-helix domain-containing protein n=1 Tax=Aquihabitans sp. G128 TaxID=2849779 RepID=UPI001C2242EF|nr:helix-turn-helix domain-containing protein [Aquihabitans sp. G128]QXC59104.1 helix-turn-helix domain-containing protein [Aquihabitans sp. G128]